MRGSVYGRRMLAAAIGISWGSEVAEAQVMPSGQFLATPAVSAFKAGNYGSAITEFEQLASQYPDDPSVLLNLASSYRIEGRLRDSERVLRKARDLAPDNPDIATYLCVTYFKQGSIAQAIDECDRAILVSPRSPAALTARTYRAKMQLIQSQNEPVDPSRPWNAFAQAAMDYDSNVNLGRGSSTDGAFRPSQYIQGEYRLLRQDGFSLFAGGSGYHANNLNSDVNDINLSSVSPAVRTTYATAVAGVPSVFELGYRYKADWLQNNFFGDLQEISPSATMAFGPRWSTVVYYAARWEKFDYTGQLPSLTSRNGFSNVEGLRQYIYFNDYQDYVTAAVDFRQIHARGENFNANVYGGEIGASFLLPAAFRFDISGRYEYENHPDFQAPENLSINRQTYTASISRILFGGLQVSLNYWYQNDDATFYAFNYSRNIGGLYIGYRF